MLPFQKRIVDSVHRSPNILLLFGRGMESVTIVRELVIENCLERKRVFVFGLSQAEKDSIKWEAANRGVEFLPKDIEKDFLRKERSQIYCSSQVLFHSAGNLAKDFLTDMIDPNNIDGFIIANAHKVYSDPGLQLAIAIYKSRNPNGFVQALSERVYEFSDIKESAELLHVGKVSFWPRFESSVEQSLKSSDVNIITVNFQSGEFESPGLKKMTHLVQELIADFLNDYGKALKLDQDSFFTIPLKSIEKRVQNDIQSEVFKSVKFLRNAYHLLFHTDPQTFAAYVEANRTQGIAHPLWVEYGEAQALIKFLPKYIAEDLPPPKLQWITKFLSDENNYGRALILAEDASTVQMIGNYLSGFMPRTDSNGADLDIDMDTMIPNLDYYGVIDKPVVMLHELRAQSDILERFQPDTVVFWDITLLSLRKLEFYSSRSDKEIVPYILQYPKINELEQMKSSAKFENDSFMRIIQASSKMVFQSIRSLPKSNRVVVVDDREFRSMFPLSLYQCGVKLLIGQLTVGDYIFSDEICVERKAYRDLVGSINSGRLLSQLQRMCQYYKRPILMIEFNDKEPFNSISSKDNSSIVMSKLTTILVQFPKVRVVWGRTPYEAAKSMLFISDGEPAPTLEAAISMGVESKEEHEDTQSSGCKFLASIPFITGEDIVKISRVYGTIKKLATSRRESLISTLGSATGVKLYNWLHSPSGTQAPN